MSSERDESKDVALLATSGLHARQILLFDPDIASLNFLAFALRRRGFEPLCASTLEAARAIFEKEPVTLAICQLREADTDGGAVLARLRARDGMRSIAVTVGALDAHGAQLSFVRPVPIIVLLRAVEALVSRPTPGR
jgi:DNA-binding response OmpR family regulator